MKTKQLIVAMVAMLTVCSHATAQSRIDKIVEELEKKDIKIGSKVVKRDPKTRQIVSVVKDYSFYSLDGNYARQLKKAFKEEAENSVEEIVHRNGDSYVLIFRDGKKKSVYTLDITKKDNSANPYVRLSIVIKDSDGSSGSWGTFNGLHFDMDGLDFNLDALDSLNFIRLEVNDPAVRKQIVEKASKARKKAAEAKKKAAEAQRKAHARWTKRMA